MSQTIESLVGTAADQIVKLKASGAIHPDANAFFQIKLNNFRYDERGPAWDQAQWAHHEKETWGTALAACVEEARDEIQATLRALPPSMQDHPLAWMAVARLFEEIILRVLTGERHSQEEVRERITLLERSLCGDPVLVTVCADLGGIFVLAPSLELEVDGVRTRLRAVTREDIEEEQVSELSSSIASLRLDRPTSAILEIEYYAPNASKWQRELDRAVALLQLFGVGDVGYTAVRFGSESLVDIGNGMILLDDGSRRPRSYVLREADFARLRRFWTVMSRVLPEQLYRGQKENPRDLAATHFWYRRALGRGGWVNEQTAEVVRALESLFIRGKMRGAISATLCQRASALLAACGLDRREVEGTLELAYKVRSRYVHGDDLTPRDEERIQKNAGDITTVFRRCLDYLRVALVATIAAGVDKDELIAAIDSERVGHPHALQAISDAFRTVFNAGELLDSPGTGGRGMGAA